MEKPDFLWDGGFIMTPAEQFHEAIEWYCTHMGWECKAIFENLGQMAFLKFPGKGQVVLKSYESLYPQFKYVEAQESRSQLCFHVEDKTRALEYFTSHDIQTTPVQKLPDGREFFEILAFSGTKLLAVTKEGVKVRHPKSRITGYSDIVNIIKAKNVRKLVDFYVDVIGMEELPYEGPAGYARLGSKDARSKLLDQIWLIPSDSDEPGLNQSTQSHFWIGPKKKDFYRAWEQLKKSGNSVSEMSGNPDNWAAFYLLDPEGNRVNVWNCK